MSEYKSENLHKALGDFVEAMRLYVYTLLSKEHGDNWVSVYIKTLSPKQISDWEKGVTNGSTPSALVDFHNLRGFALGCKDILRNDFGRDANNLPTWLGDIAEVRHKCNHYQQLDDLDFQNAYVNMLKISKQLKMDELEVRLTHYQKGESNKPIKADTPKKDVNNFAMLPWFKNIEPHLDIKNGALDESIFAANLGEVAIGNGREIYQNHTIFFQKTFFTEGLKNIIKRVVKGLNGGEESENRVVSLQTGFGGGKTHSLISVFHIAKLGKSLQNYSYAQSIFDSSSLPTFDTAKVAVFTNRTNDPAQGRRADDGTHIRTLWGEIAYQLGGIEAYNLIRENDEQMVSPKGTFKKVLTSYSPALVLIDELTDYCVSASGVTVGSGTLADQTISFVQELSESISETDNCVLVATLPASETEVANSPNAAQLLTSLSSRLGRVGADTKPVAEDEIYEVIRRRLFEDLGDKDVIDSVVNSYFDLYKSFGMEMPDYASRMEYREKLKKSYPFHPELIDMFRVRWASHHDFQRTRGVLRLLAAIISDLWKRQGSLVGNNSLIHTTDINFANLDSLSGQLKKLYGNGYDAVIDGDVSGGNSNAFRIDTDKKEYGDCNLAQGVAATILLGSFGSSASNKGLGIKDIKLCAIKPHSFNHNQINGVLDALESKAHYLYYQATAGSIDKHYWFRTQPNINILINQAKSDISQDAIHREIISRLESKNNPSSALKLLISPSEDVPEQKQPTLIVMHPRFRHSTSGLTQEGTEFVEKISTKKGNADRVYRNTLLFLVASEVGYAKLATNLKDYLACKKIQDEYKSQVDEEQKVELKRKFDEANSSSNNHLSSAYSCVLKYSVKEGVVSYLVKQFNDDFTSQLSNIVDFLKEEELLLEMVGLGLLKRNNLLPTETNSVQTKTVYETFLRYDDKPMILNSDAIKMSLQRYCVNGEYAIATGDPDKFTNTYIKEDVPFFDVLDETYWLVHTSNVVESVAAPVVSTIPGNTPSTGGSDNVEEIPVDTESISKVINSLRVTGKVDLASYTQIFSSFINPLMQNQIEINIEIKAKSTSANPLNENSSTYKVVKESAKQLGLNLDVD
ncbi:MAG: DUF499 domain-containing protein [Fibrobacterales bacterium]